MPPRKETDSIASFETEFERLNTIVDQLERGNAPLGEMLRLYEEAMTLSARLKEVLASAELRVEKLAAMHEEDASERDADDDRESIF